MSESIAHRLAVLEDCANRHFAAGSRLLDLGCGDGTDVLQWAAKGFDASGCDVGQYSDSDQCRSMYESGQLRLIDTEPYRLPFEDGWFDIVVSNQVFEHVQDYPTAIAESHRVLKPGGIAMHLFPPRWKPIEPHVFVPLAGAIQHYRWLQIWAFLGVRNEFQSDMPANDVARHNHTYLHDHTNYLSTAQLHAEFARWFDNVRFAEDIYVEHSPSGNARALRTAMHLAPFIRSAYSAFKERVVVTIKG